MNKELEKLKEDARIHEELGSLYVEQAFHLGQLSGAELCVKNLSSETNIGGVDHEPGTINGSSWKYDFWMDLLGKLRSTLAHLREGKEE